MEWIDRSIVIAYLAAMLGFGWWGKSRTRSSSDYLVAGRRLGPVFYTGTMAAVVLGGASTVGGVGLGYRYGLSGMWLVVAIGCGVLLLSLLFAATVQRLRIFTVSQMLALRYGQSLATRVSGLVMLGYTLMLCATSTGAYATIFVVLFGWSREVSILAGGVVVLVYSTIGGMWSITLADMAQFLIKTIGIFVLMLPFALLAAGGPDALASRVPPSFLDPFAAGGETILTWFVVYTLGLLIGQDIWQRVFTARSPGVARWGGATAGVYCVLYGVAGAVIGMAAHEVLPAVDSKDDVYAAVALEVLPVGVGGLVLAAAVAAMMSTASGALIAAATVARADLSALLRRRATPEPAAAGVIDPERDVMRSRWWVLGLGAVVILLAIAVQDVVAALTIAYDILVGGLLVAILGALWWPRGNGTGAGAAMIAGSAVTLGTMLWMELQSTEPYAGVYANEPIFFGLAASTLAFVVGSLVSDPTDAVTMAAWERRAAGEVAEEVALD